MSKVVLVMGGICGIGEVILCGLKDVGYIVVVIYVGNMEKVEVFKVEIGIYVYKWDVFNLEECVVGIV